VSFATVVASRWSRSFSVGNISTYMGVCWCWYALTADSFVLQLSLTNTPGNMNLDGSIPAEMSYLSSLEVLDLGEYILFPRETKCYCFSFAN
jgi:hypothetical protein